MSTRIHHGYQLVEGIDPFTFIAEARTALDPVRDRADARLIATAAVEVIDRYAHYGPVTHADVDLADAARRPLTSAWRAHRDEQDTLPATDYRHDPNRFELAIGRDETTGRYGVLLYARESLLVDAFRALPQVREYGYWNSTDRPDAITETEWADRRTFWDRLLPGHTTPVVAMLSWRLRGQHDTGLDRLVRDRSPMLVSEVPPLDERARARAQIAVADAATAGLTDPSSVMTAVSRACTTHPPQDVVDAATALLPMEIDMATLLGDRPFVPDESARAAFLAAAKTSGDQLKASLR